MCIVHAFQTNKEYKENSKNIYFIVISTNLPLQIFLTLAWYDLIENNSFKNHMHYPKNGEDLSGYWMLGFQASHGPVISFLILNPSSRHALYFDNYNAISYQGQRTQRQKIERSDQLWCCVAQWWPLTVVISVRYNIADGSTAWLKNWINNRDFPM